ncbi:hypothetical protein [Fluviicola sp.]|jgi:hypothetical protein|uniref:hypothetical protein n=1 Tax=Fluviicola sp. TaxID=1917219 RepID=UPI002832256B|nr:hypothetical protein [Fluviicola sp.]MDR0802980.1 hypothetical protein [Fluviicola sp.]
MKIDKNHINGGNKADTIQSKAGKQASVRNVLQAYKTQTTNNQVAQLRIDLQTGYPFEYIINQNDLNNGTGTTPAVRNFVNAGGPVPNPVNFAYATYRTLFDAQNGLNAVMASGPQVAPNPQIPGVNWDAGHALARQNGGLGYLNQHVFPQNREVNRGWNGTFGLWRAHEVNFHNAVGNNNHYGRWRVW